MTDKLLDFAGKVALVTGGSRGLGRQMASVGEKMAAGEGGSIINNSSTVALNPSPGSEPYGGAALYLASSTSSFTTGTTIRVDGSTS